MAHFKLKLLPVTLLLLLPLVYNAAPSYMMSTGAVQHPVKDRVDALQTAFAQSEPVNMLLVGSGGDRISFSDAATNQCADHVRLKPKGGCFSKADTQEKYLSMTFDDCPMGNTEEILDVLKAYGMRATFFVLGKNALNNPDIVKRMIDEGHTVANHTYSHQPVTLLAPEQLEHEIGFTQTVVYDITGIRPYLFRPPYGQINGNCIRFISRMGYSTVLWSVDTKDYVSAADSVDIAKTAGPGDIVLFHTKSSTGETVKMICSFYKEHSLVSVPVEELLALTQAQADGLRSLWGADIDIG